jgi:hypothetical protein
MSIEATNLDNYIVNDEDSDEELDYDIEAGAHDAERQGRESTKAKKKSRSRSKSMKSTHGAYDAKAKKTKKPSSFPKMVDVDLEKNNDSTGTENNSSGRTSVVLPKSDDPFAKRKGKTLIWSSINMILKAKSGSNGTTGEDKRLLTNVFGEVPSGQTTAIMGESSYCCLRCTWLLKYLLFTLIPSVLSPLQAQVVLERHLCSTFLLVEPLPEGTWKSSLISA